MPIIPILSIDLVNSGVKPADATSATPYYLLVFTDGTPSVRYNLNSDFIKVLRQAAVLP